MMNEVPGIPWVQPFVLAVLLFGGLALRRWGKGRAPAIGMGLLWLGVAVAAAWFTLGLTEALSLIEAG